MAQMSGNDKSPSRDWILDSGETCHEMPQFLYFTPGSLEDTDKNIEVEDGYHVAEKEK